MAIGTSTCFKSGDIVYGVIYDFVMPTIAKIRLLSPPTTRRGEEIYYRYTFIDHNPATLPAALVFETYSAAEDYISRTEQMYRIIDLT